MKTVIALICTAAVLAPSTLLAHEGHAHKVMGTVTSIDGNHLTVKATNGKNVMVMLDAKTSITQGKDKVDAKALKPGIRIVAEGPEEKGMMTATSVKVGATK